MSSNKQPCRRFQYDREAGGLTPIPERDEAVIADLAERCETVYTRMRKILYKEWRHTVVRAQNLRGNNLKGYTALIKRANDLCKAYNALPVTHHTALLLLQRTNIPFTELPPPYNELENATDAEVRQWILDWILEARERLAEGEGRTP